MFPAPLPPALLRCCSAAPRGVGFGWPLPSPPPGLGAAGPPLVSVRPVLALPLLLPAAAAPLRPMVVGAAGRPTNGGSGVPAPPPFTATAGVVTPAGETAEPARPLAAGAGRRKSRRPQLPPPFENVPGNRANSSSRRWAPDRVVSSVHAREGTAQQPWHGMGTGTGGAEPHQPYAPEFVSGQGVCGHKEVVHGRRPHAWWAPTQRMACGQAGVECHAAAAVAGCAGDPSSGRMCVGRLDHH